MAFIEKCCKCDRVEFSLWPVCEPIDDEWQPYTCTKCVDHKNEIEKTKCFVALYRMRIPPEVFEFVYTETLTAVGLPPQMSEISTCGKPVATSAWSPIHAKRHL